MVAYRVYGLELLSNIELSGLRASTSFSKPELVCRLGEFPPRLEPAREKSERPAYVSPFRDAKGLPLLQIWRLRRTQHYCFEYCEGMTFLISHDGRDVWAQWSDNVSLEDVTAFLLHQVIGFILHIRGYTCIHASAVEVEGKAVLFAGGSGSGKSSTAAAFARRGFRILSDDISAVKSEDGESQAFMIMPSVPRLCLWPDSADFLYGPGARERFPRLQPNEEKRLIGLDGSGGYSDLPARLGALYLLAPRIAASNAPRIEPLESVNSLLQLLMNGYVSGALDPERRAREFRTQGEIIRSVPVRRLVPSSDPGKLGLLCDLVLNDVRAASVSTLAGAH